MRFFRIAADRVGATTCRDFFFNFLERIGVNREVFLLEAGEQLRILWSWRSGQALTIGGRERLFAALALHLAFAHQRISDSPRASWVAALEG